MWIEYLRIALRVLRGHKFRSLLTVTSITIGAFSIVLMTSLADSGMKTLVANLEELGGTRLISIWPKGADAQEGKRISYNRGITRQDAAALRGIPHLQELSSFVVLRGKAMITEEGKRISGHVVGGDANFLAFFRYPVAQGRAIDAHDVDQRARACVVGDVLADKLWPGEGARVLGRVVTVLGLRCQIVGRLKKVDRWGGPPLGRDSDDLLVVPIETLAERDAKEVDRSRRIFLRTEDRRYNDIVKRIVNNVMMDRHHGIDDFVFFDFEKGFVGELMQLMMMMKAIVGLLAGIALLVGGVGIMNIMLVSVSERVSEIGIRKALGASPADIGRQFILEAVLLSLSGGTAGVTLGILGTIGGSAVLRHFKPHWITAISEPAALGALFVSLLIGVGFGYYPARRAGRLDPVLAIRAGK
jgi:putative ABC transport system permease protein